MLRLKVMDTFALYDVKPNYSGEAQVAKGALLGSGSGGCIAIAMIPATYESVLGVGQLES